MLSAGDIKKDFPIFRQPESGANPLCYLDNAATTQKPEQVIEAIASYYKTANANVGRGIYALGHRSTQLFETTRRRVAAFLGADAHEVIFTRGATDAVNLAASAFLSTKLAIGANVVVTQMEHHANFIPWQQLCIEKGAEFRVAPLDSRGDIDLDHFAGMIDERTALVAFTHVSNTLGTVNPVRHMTAIAHEKGVPVLVDGAQGVLTEKVDVRDLDVDFYCFSAHKMFGPTGLGVLYGKASLLEEMRPYQTGGGMIRTVSNRQTTFALPPARFEAGTPHMAGVAGFGAALEYINRIGKDHMHLHIKALNTRCRRGLEQVEGVRVLPGGRRTSGISSFVHERAHPHDMATILDQYGVAVRAGHHCTEPLMHSLNLRGTVRVSFSVYNEEWEIDRLLEGMNKVNEIFS